MIRGQGRKSGRPGVQGEVTSTSHQGWLQGKGSACLGVSGVPISRADGCQLAAGRPGSLGFWGWLGPMYWRGTWVGAVMRSVPR